jgi:hypothetical protein
MTKMHVVDTDARFIPSVELRGTRAAQLLQLDGVLSQLQAMRRTLATDDHEMATSRLSAPNPSARTWWLAGVTTAVLLGILTLLAFSTNSTGAFQVLHDVTVVHELF